MEHTPVSDIAPLEGMPLNQLNLFDTKVKDLSLINTLPLRTLWIPKTEISDISPLKGMLLESLDFEKTKGFRSDPFERDADPAFEYDGI